MTSQALVPQWVFPRPELGILLRALDPPRYALAAPFETIVRALDFLSLVAMMAAAAMAALRLRMKQPGPLRAALGLHAGFLLAMTNKYFWTTPFGYSRPFAPLFVLLLAGSGIGSGRGALMRATLVSALVDLRLFTEIKSQVLGVLHWL